MQQALQITFRGMDHSDAIESLIRERVARLDRSHPRIISCHVVVDMPHRHHRKGKRFAVHIGLATPMGEIAVTREPRDDGAEEDMHALIRGAFAAANRQLEGELGRRRGDTTTLRSAVH